jgi:SAM-dependent methyltransferase
MSKNVSDSIFDSSWQTYQKIVAANYMFHREIGSALSGVLHARFDGQPFSFLDLGCGDAAAMAPVLKNLLLCRYKGVDLSQTALALAASNLADLPCQVELAHGDFSAALAKECDFYDVIYSSFALHHLPTEEKAEFFRRAARRLDEGGLLLLVDVMREEGESLEAYHRHYCGWLRSSWALDPQEMDSLCDHIINNDLPEPPAVLKAQALAAGLGKTSEAARYNWHRILRFAQK